MTQRFPDPFQDAQSLQVSAGSDLGPDLKACIPGSLPFHTKPGWCHLCGHLTRGRSLAPLCPGGASGQSMLAIGKTQTRYLTSNPYPSPAMTKIECIFKYIKTIGTQLGKQLQTGGCSCRRSHPRCGRGGGRSDSSRGNSGAQTKITEFKGRQSCFLERPAGRDHKPVSSGTIQA